MYWLAVEVAHYRAVHGLSQRQLAQHLGVHQSDIARVERLIRVASGLDLELMIDIRPRGRNAKLLRKRALEATSYVSGECELVLATA